MEANVSKELIKQLVDGTIDKENSTRLLKMDRKDKDRFFNYIAVLQERARWDDRILMRLGDKVYIVINAERHRVVKCECGHEFCDYRKNWKLQCKIRTRRTLEEMQQVYDLAPAVPEPGWQEIREFFCPSCASQLAVEIVAPGYPIVFEMLPDLDKFYREYLGDPLDDESSEWYQDLTHSVTQQWASEAS
ncbi:MAG TPA: acetone carboxylase subunit gamma [Gammaproteobacteria bacterium]|nr:acetone carboxylase subunit gamma [Gammaproteobacteria bacterium]